MSIPSVEAHTRISRYGLVNAFLVQEEDGLTLIDTALKGSAKKILAAAAGLDAPIVRIALTHAHNDHVGALDELAAKLRDAEVLISAREAILLTGDTSLQPGETGRLRGGFPGRRTKPTRTIADGDVIGSLQVHACPGHTPGHLAFLDTRDRTLYCGDVYSTLFGVYTSATVNPLFPLPARATWDRELVLESAIHLRTLEPYALAPGHGPVNIDALEQMDDAIAKAA
ncbi:MAG: MBL fold metallo-hydrolase [Actinomycetes bacterium]|nr:MAG: MBL fold metallo-hydrolase [Actinomycetes bacterium]